MDAGSAQLIVDHRDQITNRLGEEIMELNDVEFVRFIEAVTMARDIQTAGEHNIGMYL